MSGSAGPFSPDCARLAGALARATSYSRVQFFGSMSLPRTPERIPRAMAIERRASPRLAAVPNVAVVEFKRRRRSQLAGASLVNIGTTGALVQMRDKPNLNATIWIGLVHPVRTRFQMGTAVRIDEGWARGRRVRARVQPDVPLDRDPRGRLWLGLAGRDLGGSGHVRGLRRADRRTIGPTGVGPGTRLAAGAPSYSWSFRILWRRAFWHRVSERSGIPRLAADLCDAKHTYKWLFRVSCGYQDLDVRPQSDDQRSENQAFSRLRSG